MSEKHFEDKKYFLRCFSQGTKELLFQQPNSGWRHEIQTHTPVDFSIKHHREKVKEGSLAQQGVLIIALTSSLELFAILNGL